MFNKKFYEKLADGFQNVDPGFNSRQFVKEVTQNLEMLSLNQRLRNTSILLNKYLPSDYEKAIGIMKQVIPFMDKGYTSLVFPDYVGLFGINWFTISMEALKYFTQFGSSEFAIREFLKQDLEKTIRVMCTWADDKDHHVRRLASEGSRPRLPWSFKLDGVIKNPEITRPILEKLKTDEHLYVKKSVANHLNDFSKDRPDYMLDVISTWDQNNPHTKWITKRGCRTLIKKGNKRSLAIFEFEKNVRIKIINFKISNPTIRLNDTLQFGFGIVSQKSITQKICVDYNLHYCKKSGELLPKVFKLRELELKPGETIWINKKQAFKDLTTRKHYTGIHCLEILINGKVVVKKNFKLCI